MKQSRQKNFRFALGGLSIALMIALFISPFSSQNPDGLDRTARDLAFDAKAQAHTIAHRLPTATIFNEYNVRGVPQGFATPLAGLAGTLMTFGLGWGLGKVVEKRRRHRSTSGD